MQHLHTQRERARARERERATEACSISSSHCVAAPTYRSLLDNLHSVYQPILTPARSVVIIGYSLHSFQGAFTPLPACVPPAHACFKALEFSLHGSRRRGRLGRCSVSCAARPSCSLLPFPAALSSTDLQLLHHPGGAVPQPLQD